MSDLLGVEQGAPGHLGPEVIIRNQLVVRQSVNAVCLHDGALVQLVLVGCSCSCESRDEFSLYSLGGDKEPGLCKMWKKQKQKLTLESWLPSQNLPELLGSVAVCAGALLDDLDIFSTATQISLALDEVCQLQSLKTETKTFRALHRRAASFNTWQASS